MLMAINRAVASSLVSGLLLAMSLAWLGGSREAVAQVKGGTSTQTTGGPALDLAMYRHVAQVTWVVRDVDRVVGYWQQMGVKDIRRDGVVRFSNMRYRGKLDPAEAKQVTAKVGHLEIKWIQPLRGGKFWHDELRIHGDGICVLSYEAGSREQFDEQIKYFASKRVGVVVQDKWQTSKGEGRTAYLDTAAQGGGTMLGLIDDPEVRSGRDVANSSANEYPLQKITHFAWVVKDVRRVDAYYTGLGFEPLSRIDHNVSLDRVYRNQPGDYEMWLGWNRTGDAPFEWVQQITGSDVYVEYGKAHGEGFHHLGVMVADMDQAVKLMSERGAPPSQSAAWSTKKGKGRAVYLDTEPYGGVTLELIYDPN